MNPKVEKLFSGKNLVYIATLMKDGSPQLSPVWAEISDGHILVNTAAGRVKHKNILRDPRVAISLVSENNHLDMACIRGIVVDVISDEQYSHADKLTAKYTGSKRYPYRKPGEHRIIFKIKVEHVFIMPELTPTE